LAAVVPDRADVPRRPADGNGKRSGLSPTNSTANRESAQDAEAGLDQVRHAFLPIPWLDE
jgi:hypothetical protein